MQPIDYAQVLADLNRFDIAVSGLQADSVVGGALDYVQQDLQQPYGSVLLRGLDDQKLRLLTRSGGGISASESFVLQTPGGLIRRAIEGGAPVYCEDLAVGPRQADDLRLQVPAEIRALAVLPLQAADAVLGTFNVGFRRCNGIAPDQQIFLETAAARLAAALRRAQATETLGLHCERLQQECDLQRSALRKSHNDLERQVAERTAEIQRLQERLQAENIYLKEELAGVHAYGGIIGESLALKAVIARIARVAPTNANVLILGESGTGKELIAREIHRQSARRDRPMIKVNCATIPKDLYESEFFGHIKGAFTGAVSDRVGRFEAADGGSLFLDEVGEIPTRLQGKLLRVLQEGEFERVGEARTRRVDVRIIAATNKNLREEIKSGRFREDLYYRLNVFPIEVSPLRERQEDIPLLAQHFIEVFSRRLNRPPARLTAANLIDLKAHDWPGNVRELQNIIERALILSPQGPLRFDLPRINAGFPSAGQELREDDPQPTLEVMTEAEIRTLERQNMHAALNRSGWKIYGKDGAAQLLGIKPTTLIERMRRLGMKRTA